MPTSITITDLIGAYSASEFDIRPALSTDQAPRINRALGHIAGQSPANGTLFLPPGTYTIRTSVELVANVALVGAGPATILQLGNDSLVDVLTASSVGNFRVANLRVDGNRANNAAGTRSCIQLTSCTDAVLENVEAVSARADGFRLDTCERVELRGCRASDNGRHGISLSFCTFCQVLSPRCYDNCQVSTAGAADGLNLELLTSDTTIICPMCYETALAGDRQGYGVREASGEGCARNLVVGGALRGNRTGQISLDAGDSAAFTFPLMQIPGAFTITA